jgi:hypothetical protein
MNIGSKYELQKLVSYGETITFRAREIATGNLVYLHLIGGGRHSPLLEAVRKCPPGTPVETGELDDMPFVVTEFFTPFTSLRAWLERVSEERRKPDPPRAAPREVPGPITPPQPSGPGEFTRMIQGPAGGPRLQDPGRPPQTPAPSAPGEFTRMFAATPGVAGEPAAPAKPASGPGEFTRMFSQVPPGSPAAPPAPSPFATPPAGPERASGLFQQPSAFATPPASDPAATRPPVAPASAPPPGPAAVERGRTPGLPQPPPDLPARSGTEKPVAPQTPAQFSPAASPFGQPLPPGDASGLFEQPPVFPPPGGRVAAGPQPPGPVPSPAVQSPPASRMPPVREEGRRFTEYFQRPGAPGAIDMDAEDRSATPPVFEGPKSAPFREAGAFTRMFGVPVAGEAEGEAGGSPAPHAPSALPQRPALQLSQDASGLFGQQPLGSPAQSSDAERGPGSYAPPVDRSRPERISATPGPVTASAQPAPGSIQAAPLPPRTGGLLGTVLIVTATVAVVLGLVFVVFLLAR